MVETTVNQPAELENTNGQSNMAELPKTTETLEERVERRINETGDRLAVSSKLN